MPVSHAARCIILVNLEDSSTPKSKEAYMGTLRLYEGYDRPFLGQTTTKTSLDPPFQYIGSRYPSDFFTSCQEHSSKGPWESAAP